MTAGDARDGPAAPAGAAGGDGVAAPASGRGARIAAWLAVGALVAALVALPFGDSGLLAGGTLAEVAAGDVQRRTADGWTAAPAGTELSNGDVVRTRDGRTTLRLADGGTARLAPATRLRLTTDGLEVPTGSVLLEVGEPVSARWEGLEARGSGAWRLDTAGFTRAGVYRGRVTVRDPAGSELTVGRLQQASLTDGTVNGEPGPLRYSPADPWDARLLAGAIATDRFVDQLQQSLTSQYGDRARGADFYRAFTADPAVSEALLSRLAGGETDGGVGRPDRVLTALTVAQTLVGRADLDPASAAEQVVTLRSAGARWGLILARHRLGAEALREVVDQALQQAQEGPGAAPGGPADGGAPGPGAPDGDGAAEEPADGGGPDDTPAGGGDDGQEPDAPDGGPGDDDGPGNGGSEPPSDDDVVGGVVDGVTGTVDGLLPGTPVDETTDAVGDLLNSQSSGGSGDDGAEASGSTATGSAAPTDGSGGGSTDGGSRDGSGPAPSSGSDSPDGSGSGTTSGSGSGSGAAGPDDGSAQQEDPPTDAPLEDTLDGVGGTVDGLLPGDPLDGTTDSVGGLLD